MSDLNFGMDAPSGKAVELIFLQLDIARQYIAERDRQDAKWGPRKGLPNGTSVEDKIYADEAKAWTDAEDARGELTWRSILNEEIKEAFAEEDGELLYAELTQSAAVIMKWQEDLRSQGFGLV